MQIDTMMGMYKSPPSKINMSKEDMLLYKEKINLVTMALMMKLDLAPSYRDEAFNTYFNDIREIEAEIQSVNFTKSMIDWL